MNPQKWEVWKVWFDEAQKIKFLVVMEVDQQSKKAYGFFINTLPRTAFSTVAGITFCSFPMAPADYPFLHHDSHLSTQNVMVIPLGKFRGSVPLGTISVAKQKLIISHLKQCPRLTMDQINKWFFI